MRGTIPAGVPLGTKFEPWLLTIIFINDLVVAGVVIRNHIWAHEASRMQGYVDDLARQSLTNNFVLNEANSKEFRISFGKTEPSFNPIVINDKPIGLVTSAKVYRSKHL